MAARNRQRLDAENLTNRLRMKNAVSERQLFDKNSEAKSFYDTLKLRPGQIRQHAARMLTSGALAGTLLLSPALPLTAAAIPFVTSDQNQSVLSQEQAPGQLRHGLRETLAKNLPAGENWHLNSEQEKAISGALKKEFGITASAELSGNRLNNAYGRMGAEQHLPRFPGDTIYQHDELQDKGITPGLGAWGYFAPSKQAMTPELYNSEKWYVAVQTLYLPNWNTDTAKLAAWYKYRHVVVVNPENGKTVVCDIADAGPALWTGKQFGGSPEVMQYLGTNLGMQNAPVVLFFLDDPKGEIPLGPLEYNVEKHRQSQQDRA